MKYINKMIYKLKMIYNNIKYILTREIVNIVDTIDIRLDNLEHDMENKVEEYSVEDIIYNIMGNSEDYVNYDDMDDVKDELSILDDIMNDIKDEIKDVKASLKNYVDTYEMVMEHLKNGGFSDEVIERNIEELIDDVIIAIISRLENNKNV